ncbi:DUF1328 domain-containing protein [Zunongwangia sp. F260]|uniref:DUF1328 domain-containing protein n=2 Tax=Autumnicola TaxID=3160927 RepID=A0ABU3CKF1_9FLAO|nr:MULTISPECIES: DUF1328 domain-containing protein [unclassified Zunongwangia]MDT0646786.1 DUF1328 domain-containing protein [Zunongwangia sp. F260]MDT0686915.1 DUF1328 domain-containing protein [Zunongwangia sp. F225]
MKKKIIIFLAFTLLTGLIGFSGMNFDGIAAVRVMFLIFADLLLVTILASFFFSSNQQQVRLERVKNK